jgi:hypothetical protein
MMGVPCMAGGKNNTQRIETLESEASNLWARLDTHDIQLGWIIEGLNKGTERTERHASSITVIDQEPSTLQGVKHDTQ